MEEKQPIPLFDANGYPIIEMDRELRQKCELSSTQAECYTYGKKRTSIIFNWYLF